jgi:hypothetical protein
MEKRPTSLTVIAWLLIVLNLIGLALVFVMGSNPAMLKATEQMHVSLVFLQAWSVVGTIINLLCAYGILKGLPWSRVLYVVWGIIGLGVSAYSSPNKASVVLGLIIFVIISVFLWTNTANDWFQARGLMVSRERNPLAR